MNINVANSYSILGQVASVRIRRQHGNESIYLEITDLENDVVIAGNTLGTAGRSFILTQSHGDASVRELRNAIATVSDMFMAEATLGGIARLLEESFWARLALEVEVEFNVISTGHGIIDSPNARIILQTKEVA